VLENGTRSTSLRPSAMAEKPTRDCTLIGWVVHGAGGAQARDAILNIHTRKWAAPPAEALRAELAQACVGYCGADLKALCTEAMLRALRRSLPEIYTTDEKLQVSAPINGSSHTSSIYTKSQSYLPRFHPQSRPTAGAHGGGCGGPRLLAQPPLCAKFPVRAMLN
jgi:hypothetical protein